MSVILLGGVTRYLELYAKGAQAFGIDLHVLDESSLNLADGLQHMDAVVIFAGKISHDARINVFTEAKKRRIPVFMHHACGVCALWECLNCIKLIKGGKQ